MQGTRIWRSPYIHFYKDEIPNAPKVYTEEFLRGVAEAGFNAIWIRGILREIVKSEFFPEFGENSATLLRCLRTVINRGRKAGVKVFLYSQPPYGFDSDSPFWKKHPDCKGSSWVWGGMRRNALCTSSPKVTGFLREAARTLSQRLPDLGGLIVITASEHQSHCFSHYSVMRDDPSHLEGEPFKRNLDCPRCALRHPREVVAEIIGNLRDGLADAGNGAELWAWNWSWKLYEGEPQAEIIKSLPSDVMLMGDFERGGSKVIVGKERVIDEYSLCYAGPSPRFLNSMRIARARGMRMGAKLQIGTTHELATVPNLPLIGTIYDKAKAMRKIRVGDFMGCWNFGNMLTANTAALAAFLDAPRLAPREAALRRFAAEYLPGSDVEGVARAWDMFAGAMDSYPFTIPFIYYGPINFAVQWPILPEPLRSGGTGRSWQADTDRGDELERSFGAFTLEEIIEGLGNLARDWWKAAEAFDAAVAGSASPHAGEERRSVWFAAHSFRSCWNLYRAYPLRRKWKQANAKALRPIMQDELEHLPGLLPLMEEDARLGFHSECQHRLATPEGVRAKIRELRRVLGSRA